MATDSVLGFSARAATLKEERPADSLPRHEIEARSLISGEFIECGGGFFRVGKTTCLLFLVGLNWLYCLPF
ncbi:MAG: hypothetical protein D6728_12700 [Cyanobacteria bacterium J055]|nr:MAG: hypothetical protein D6728_12700 [Cyanobacteria bacterium J055]